MSDETTAIAMSGRVHLTALEGLTAEQVRVFTAVGIEHVDQAVNYDGDLNRLQGVADDDVQALATAVASRLAGKRFMAATTPASNPSLPIPDPEPTLRIRRAWRSFITEWLVLACALWCLVYVSTGDRVDALHEVNGHLIMRLLIAGAIVYAVGSMMFKQLLDHYEVGDSGVTWYRGIIYLNTSRVQYTSGRYGFITVWPSAL